MNHPGDAPQSTTDKLVARKEGAIGWIVFNNPARHNAVSLEMWDAPPRATSRGARRWSTTATRARTNVEGQTAFMEKRKPVFNGR